MAAKLILTRKGSMFNRRQRYKVLIDGVVVGEIKNDDTEEFVLSAGPHTLQCKINWMSSAIETIELNEGSNKYMSVSSGLKFFLPLYIMLLAGILIPFFLQVTNAPIPSFVNVLKVVLVLPAVIYLVLYMTVFRKKYLVVGEDKSNPFK